MIELSQQAIALEQHLQWRTTPWYTKAKMYLQGDQALNLNDYSSHRWSNIRLGVAWALVVILSLAALIAGYLVYMGRWHPWNIGSPVQ